MITWQITDIEKGTLAKDWSPAINPNPPDYFDFQQGPSGVQIFCQGAAGKYGGALVKAVNTLIHESPTITFKYGVTLDQSIAMGQVIETDSKITDSKGWTYDGSLQWIVNGWEIWLYDPWVHTGVKIPLSRGMNQVAIVYALDYSGHTIQVVSVNGVPLNAKPNPASQIGWQASSIVTQLQLCLGAAGGIYDLLFSGISYSGQG
jgi:hypothetical protein